MNLNYLFYVDVEVKAAEGNMEMPDHLKGAFVNCYTYATDVEEAKKKVLSCLEEDEYDIIELNDCYRIDEEDFAKYAADNEHGEPTLDELKILREKGDVYYAAFHSYLDD